MTKIIMTVDDSKTMREMLAFTLREAGYDVREAEDGQKALAALGSITVDAIITDLNMPELDGVALITRLRADPRHRATPILMLTTETDSEKKAQGRAAGATGWLVKPFSPDKLIDVLQRVCG